MSWAYMSRLNLTVSSLLRFERFVIVFWVLFGHSKFMVCRRWLLLGTSLMFLIEEDFECLRGNENLFFTSYGCFLEPGWPAELLLLLDPDLTLFFLPLWYDGLRRAYSSA